MDVCTELRDLEDFQQPSGQTQNPRSSANLTPSKRSAQNDGADLARLLSKCTAVLCDPELKSPLRRTLHTMLHRGLTEAASKASKIQDEEQDMVSHSGQFEDMPGFRYRPMYSPARLKSAAERRSTASLAAQLAVGSDNLLKSTVQAKLDERKPARRLDQRSMRIQDRLAGNSARSDNTCN
jgi:hypothetical protein